MMSAIFNLMQGRIKTKSHTVSKNMLLLITSNLIVALQAIYFNWELSTLIWAYWFQALIIVLVAYKISLRKIAWVVLLLPVLFYMIFLLLLTFPSDAITYTVNSQQVSPEEFTVLKNVSWLGVLSASTLFGLNHLMSSVFDGSGKSENRNITNVVKRILPLHIMIFAVMFVPMPLLLFMTLKTVADVWAHYIQHSGKQWVRTRGKFTLT
jgi:hypothetical protein